MNIEVQALVEKARESEGAASLLRREGYLNFAASRAYYAMFYAAEALLLARGLSFSSHSAVMAAFGREFAKTGSLEPRLHQHLINAFNMRNIGDYDTRASFTGEQVDELLTWAREFIRAAEAFLATQSDATTDG
jgi:uncharacterized protein (UPF0332 family)